MRDTVEERFWTKVDRSGGSDACWPWLFAKRHGGYGNFWLDGAPQGAHRVAFGLTNGPVPAGLFVCHRCDNPPCCNPAHLYAGTHDENQRDKAIRCRAPAKIDKATAIEIREALTGGLGPKRVARLVGGVGASEIRAIQERRCWAWLDEDPECCAREERARVRRHLTPILRVLRARIAALAIQERLVGTVTTDEAAAILGITPRGFRLHGLPRERIAGVFRYRRADVEALLARRTARLLRRAA